jgi:hypothetical protein
MSAYKKLRNRFDPSWSTILVGWSGLGKLTTWPDPREEFPPLLSAKDLEDFALEKLQSSCDGSEQEAIAELLSLNLREARREEIISVLTRLAKGESRDDSIDVRKWRLALLEEVLEKLPKDPIYALTELTEFWGQFGFPSDSPHIAQGVGNSIDPTEYFRQENLDRTLLRHEGWIKNEVESIKRENSNRAV